MPKKKQERVVTRTEQEIGFKCLNVCRLLADREDLQTELDDLSKLIDKYFKEKGLLFHGDEDWFF